MEIYPPNLSCDQMERSIKDASISCFISFGAFYVFGSSIEDYLHLILPVIVRSFENPLAPEELRKAALRTTGQLCRKVNFADHASQIIHPLVRSLGNSESDLRGIAMDTLCTLVLQFGPDYAIFIPMVNKVSYRNHRTEICS